MTEADTELLAKVKALYETQPFHAVRPDEAHMDILRSWHRSEQIFILPGNLMTWSGWQRRQRIAISVRIRAPRCTR